MRTSRANTASSLALLPAPVGPDLLLPTLPDPVPHTATPHATNQQVHHTVIQILTDQILPIADRVRPHTTRAHLPAAVTVPLPTAVHHTADPLPPEAADPPTVEVLHTAAVADDKTNFNKTFLKQ